jgi:hypothetical protein
VARREVVAAIEHDVGVVDQSRELSITDARCHTLDAHFGIDRSKPPGGGIHFRATDVGGRIKNLPLEVGEVDMVGVAQRQRADAGRGEEMRGGIAESADADHERACRGELFLRIGTELRQQDMAAVAKQLRVVHRAPVLKKDKRPAQGRALSRFGFGAVYCFIGAAACVACAWTARVDVMTGVPFN